MNWVDRLLGKPQKDPNADIVGPIGGSEQPAHPLDTAPYISPGNPGGTYSPNRADIPVIDAQQTPLLYDSIPKSPTVGDLSQQVLWPQEVTSYVTTNAAPFKDRGPDPRWIPVPNDGPVNGHRNYSFNRPWHLAPKLDGNRTYLDNQDRPVTSTEGFSGLRKAPRATMFTEPAPWSTNVVDTTHATGTPLSPGVPSNVSAVSVTGDNLHSTNRGTYRLM
jgi:hypothetical protein